MATKITKAQSFNAIREILVSADRPDLVAVIDHELELLANKAAKRSSTPTKAQSAGLALKADILAVLTENGEAMTIPEIIAALPNSEGVSSNKVTAQLVKLIDTDHTVTREIIKRTRYYKAV